ncbi:hypothetical protein [Thiothrix nivea]|uniref:Ankyrin n=1 Tax=Thiothrix nivea (strain ATCC 35100 / DSM 5205 / JP2) TaxID=870187 RepID=A0A656HHE3_THINJ|nr:hypothetical protein [Thiothrix nivea]EIJ35632.1 hypothetical protein Thini_3109 [Thiothrix nivea DSM 5205]
MQPTDLTIALQIALNQDDREQVSTLRNAGADIHYLREGGYGPLIDVMYGRHSDSRQAVLYT